MDYIKKFIVEIFLAASWMVGYIYTFFDIEWINEAVRENESTITAWGALFITLAGLSRWIYNSTKAIQRIRGKDKNEEDSSI